MVDTSRTIQTPNGNFRVYFHWGSLMTRITRVDRLLSAGPTRLALKQGHSIQCASHLRQALEPHMRRDLIKSLVRILKHHDFDSIACRGLSGLLVAPTVAMMMDKTLLVIRKQDEDCHSWRAVEGDANALRYVIIDDLICSGDTVKAILRAMERERIDAKCIGVIQYLYITSTTEPLDAVEPLTNFGTTFE